MGLVAGGYLPEEDRGDAVAIKAAIEGVISDLACTVTIDETRSAKQRGNRAGRPLRPVRSPAIAELPYLS